MTLYDATLNFTATFLNGLLIASVIGIIIGLCALVLQIMIIKGHLASPTFERLWIIPQIQKGLHKYPGKPMPTRITKYLDRARERGLIS